MRVLRLLAACVGVAAFWIIGAATIGHFAGAQDKACRYFKVQSPSLNISKEPRGDSIFIDVLEKGDVVCVTQDQKEGGRDWALLAHKVVTPGERRPIAGWANLRLLQPLSRAEAAALDQGPKVAASSPNTPAAPSTPAQSDEALRFDQPIAFGPFPVNGRSIAQLSTGIPLFPPIEGLDEALWKKNCGACHVWDKRQLCEQGASYAKNPKAALRHPHPYGGAYKVALMQWAKSGCQ